MAGVKKVTVEETVKKLVSLGVYKPEHNTVIEIYVGLVTQYISIEKQFKTKKYQVETPTGTGGFKTSPIVTTLESLRRDILSYTDRLCLNPKALDAVDIVVARNSKLDAALTKIGEALSSPPNTNA